MRLEGTQADGGGHPTRPGHHRQGAHPGDPFGAVPEPAGDLGVVDTVRAQAQDASLEGTKTGNGFHV